MYEIVQTGNESRGQVTINWDADQAGLIPPSALSIKLRAWFAEQLPGKRISVKGSKTKRVRVAKVWWG